MLPRDLKAEQFAGYPPQARKVVAAHLGALQQLPLSFLPSLLREVIDYDYKFPAERTAIDKELANLSSFAPVQFNDWFQGFSRLAVSSQLEKFDWINLPGQFVEQLSAYLWTTGQLDDFRKAAIVYGDRLRAVAPADPVPVRRLGIAVIGQGVESYEAPLFRNLRKHGAYFGRVKPDNGVGLLLNAVAARAKAHPVAYGHWYVDGGQPAECDPLLTCVSYQGLAPARAALLRNIQTELQRPGMGPEQLRTHLARLSPSDLGMDRAGSQVLEHFQVKLLTEGSGTQIFSTTFAQWTAREALRRAQPLTLLVRFAPRQRQKPMNELLAGGQGENDLDPAGSLVDADMGAYYNWVNQQRLAGAEQSAFLVWFEGHRQAVVIGPSLPRGTESTTVADLGELVSLAAG
jgi:hypothetical protein